MRFVGSQPDIEANVASGADVALRPVPLERLNVPRPERGAVAIPVSPLSPSRLAPAFNLTNERARAFCDRVAQGPSGCCRRVPGTSASHPATSSCRGRNSLSLVARARRPYLQNCAGRPGPTADAAVRGWRGIRGEP